MRPERDEGMDKAIDQFWDQIIQSPSHPVEGLPPADAATIRHLHAFDDRPGPQRAFVQHLREDLMQAYAVPVSSDPHSPIPSYQQPHQLWRSCAASRPWIGRKSGWKLTYLATAALLLLTLIGSIVAFGPDRLGQRDTAAVLPAISESSATPQSLASKRLLTATIPAGADMANAVFSVARVPYAAGEGNSAMTFLGPTLFAVRSGTLTVRVDGLAELALHGTPTSDGSAQSVLAAGIEQQLQPGDAIIVPAGMPISLHNPGPQAAEGLAIGVLLDSAEGSHVSELWPLLGKGLLESLTTPATITVDEVLLAAGSALDQHEALGMTFVNVEAGTVMTAVEEGDVESSSGPYLRTGAVGPGAAFMGAGQERRLREGAGLFVHQGAIYTLRNEGGEPARLLIVRLAPASGTEAAVPATPAS